ncbi:hypothetical protein DESC_940065 [Desulfosarcina cetonica]|nr:hypothetical protein DESC_940065 [Desulfosarcina cetonica]
MFDNRHGRFLTTITLLLLSSIFSLLAVLADWKTDVGYVTLADELGDDLPDGTGLPVCQVEAAATVDDAYTWMPDPNNTVFSGETLNDCNGASDGIFSSHATSVVKLFYGDSVSMASGITDIDVHNAGHWMLYGYLYSGYSHQPAQTACRMANHRTIAGWDRAWMTTRRRRFCCDAWTGPWTETNASRRWAWSTVPQSCVPCRHRSSMLLPWVVPTASTVGVARPWMTYTRPDAHAPTWWRL